MSEKRITELHQIFEEEPVSDIVKQRVKVPSKSTSKLINLRRMQQTSTPSSVFRIDNNSKEVLNQQDERGTDKQKFTVEERNRNKRFLQSVFDSESRVDEINSLEHSHSQDEKHHGKHSISSELGRVTPHPFKRMQKQIVDSEGRLEYLQVNQKAKKSLFAKDKAKKQQTPFEEGYLSNKDSKNGSLMRFKSFKFKQRKSLMKELHEGEQENTHYERIFQHIKRATFKRWFLILPDSNFRMIVDFISFFIILYISVQIPLMLTFLQDSNNRTLNLIESGIDSWFLVELVLNFMTAYYDRGHLVKNRKSIAIQYLRTWFLLDFVSSFPFSLIYLNNEASPGVAQQSTKIFRVIRLVKYLRFLRILRFIKANKVVQNIEEQLISESSNFVSKLLKLLFLTFFLSHWLACFFYGIGILGSGGGGNSWIIDNGFVDDGLFKQYINALYWAITTMTTVGMGDISPGTTEERMAGIVTVIFSSCLFGFIIQDIGKMVSNYNQLANQFKERILYVEQFMKNKKFPSSLRIQIRRYLDYCMEQKSLEKIEEDDVMSLLNEDLRSKLQVYLYGGIFARIKLLNSFSVELLSSLTFILVKQAYTVNEDLFVEGDRGSQIFYINSGKISIVHKQSRTFIKDLKKKDYFGEIAFFTDLARQASAKARDFTEVIILDRKAFITIAKNVCPESLTKLQNICERIDYEKKEFKALQLSCYLCEVVGHISIDCKQFEGTIKGNISKYDDTIINIRASFHKKISMHNSFEEVKDINSLSYGVSQDQQDQQAQQSMSLINLSPDARKFRTKIKIEPMDFTEINNYEDVFQNQDQQNQIVSADIPSKNSFKIVQGQGDQELPNGNQLSIMPLEQEGDQVRRNSMRRESIFGSFRKARPSSKKLQFQTDSSKLTIEVKNGKKNVPRSSNILTRKIAKLKRFSSVEKRKEEKAEKPNQEQQGRIINIKEDQLNDEQQSSPRINLNVQQNNCNSYQKLQVRNVFHPDYEQNNDQSERNEGIYAQVTNNSPMYRLYQKLIGVQRDNSIFKQGSSPESQKKKKMDLILRNQIIPAKLEDQNQPHHTSFKRIVNRNRTQRDLYKNGTKPSQKSNISLNEVFNQWKTRSNRLVRKPQPRSLNYQKTSKNKSSFKGFNSNSKLSKYSESYTVSQNQKRNHAEEIRVNEGKDLEQA